MLVRRRPELLEAQARADSSLNVLFSLILHTRGFYGMLMFPHHIFFRSGRFFVINGVYFCVVTMVLSWRV